MSNNTIVCPNCEGIIDQMSVCKHCDGRGTILAKHDPVNRPSHYTDGKIEVIDFIEDKRLGFHLGNAVKYISRAGKKDPAKTIEDLKKAAWYLNRQIETLESK